MRSNPWHLQVSINQIQEVNFTIPDTVCLVWATTPREAVVEMSAQLGEDGLERGAQRGRLVLSFALALRWV
jgi:hypothetical protein